jgi:hypothetical protein
MTPAPACGRMATQGGIVMAAKIYPRGDSRGVWEGIPMHFRHNHAILQAADAGKETT